MPHLTIQDNVDLVKYYYQNGENISAAIRAYCTAHKIKERKYAPVYNTVKLMMPLLKKQGSCYPDEGIRHKALQTKI